MKKYGIILFFLLCVPKMDAQIIEKLQNIGMENIRCAETEKVKTIAFEDNVYRGSYRGIGKAVDACLESRENKSVQLVVLDNRVPQLCISLSDTLLHAYSNGEISPEQVYASMEISVDTDNAMNALKGTTKGKNPSAWKADIVVYPELFLQNNSFDKLYRYAISLSPALEMGLWKGGKLTAQAVIPIATNLKGEYHRIHPGIIALSQEVRWRHNIFGRIAAGNFSRNRMGVLLDLKYRSDNGRLELGAAIGSTVYSAIIDDEGWYVSNEQKVNASMTASVYEPHTNLQFDLQAGRYVYGDYGVRGDCTRHFGEYAIGLYAMYIEGEVNGGFHLAIPLPGKKWKRNRAVRIKPAEYFAWTYSMVSHGKYINERMGRSYSVEPDDNKSSGYYQPDFIRYFLIKETERKSK